MAQNNPPKVVAKKTRRVGHTPNCPYQHYQPYLDGSASVVQDPVPTPPHDKLSMAFLAEEVSKMKGKLIALEMSLSTAEGSLKTTNPNVREPAYANNFREEERRELAEDMEAMNSTVKRLVSQVRGATSTITTICARVRLMRTLQRSAENAQQGRVERGGRAAAVAVIADYADAVRNMERLQLTQSINARPAAVEEEENGGESNQGQGVESEDKKE